MTTKMKVASQSPILTLGHHHHLHQQQHPLLPLPPPPPPHHHHNHNHYEDNSHCYVDHSSSSSSSLPLINKMLEMISTTSSPSVTSSSSINLTASALSSSAAAATTIASSSSSSSFSSSSTPTTSSLTPSAPSSFSSQLATFTQMFKSLSDCDKVVALCVLARMIKKSHIIFLINIFKKMSLSTSNNINNISKEKHYNYKATNNSNNNNNNNVDDDDDDDNGDEDFDDDVEFIDDYESLEHLANDATYLRQLVNKPLAFILNKVLLLFPMLRLENFDAKMEYLKIIPRLLSNSTTTTSKNDATSSNNNNKTRQLLTYLYIHPALNKHEITNIVLQLDGTNNANIDAYSENILGTSPFNSKSQNFIPKPKRNVAYSFSNNFSFANSHQQQQLNQQQQQQLQQQQLLLLQFLQQHQQLTNISRESPTMKHSPTDQHQIPKHVSTQQHYQQLTSHRQYFSPSQLPITNQQRQPNFQQLQHQPQQLNCTKAKRPLKSSASLSIPDQKLTLCSTSGSNLINIDINNKTSNKNDNINKGSNISDDINTDISKNNINSKSGDEISANQISDNNNNDVVTNANSDQNDNSKSNNNSNDYIKNSNDSISTDSNQNDPNIASKITKAEALKNVHFNLQQSLSNYESGAPKSSGHQKLSRTKSLVPDWLNKGQSNEETTSCHANSAHQTVSRRSSAASSDSNDESKTTTSNSLEYDWSTLVYKWLKDLRLHKYANLIRHMTYNQLLNIDEDWLVKMGVTKGARDKLMNNLKKLPDRAKNLEIYEKELKTSPENIHRIISDLTHIVKTPLAKHNDVTNVDGQSDAANEFSNFESNVPKMAQQNVDLTEKIIYLLGKVCTELLTSKQHDSVSCSVYLELLNLCSVHPSFSEEQRKKLLPWKHQINKQQYIERNRVLSCKQQNSINRLSGISTRVGPNSHTPLARRSTTTTAASSSSLSSFTTNQDHHHNLENTHHPLNHRLTHFRQQHTMLTPSSSSSFVSKDQADDDLKAKLQVGRTHSAPLNTGLKLSTVNVERWVSNLDPFMEKHALGDMLNDI